MSGQGLPPSLAMGCFAPGPGHMPSKHPGQVLKLNPKSRSTPHQEGFSVSLPSDWGLWLSLAHWK